ncbi:MAG: hypothetical protein JNK87_06045 [Bryobacterales bacterium]|nr:hypothetical protein [Bryobacterales bacterium]
MPYRLGDDVDDYCIKCKRVTNHSIVSLLNEDPAKVRCRTCYNDHDFRRCEIPPSKKDLKKAQLLQEVLAGGGAAPAADGETPAVAGEVPAEGEVPVEGDAAEAPKAKKGARKGRTA